MTKILLDTNVLLSRPDILSQRAPGVTFAVPPQVIAELRRNAQRNRWLGSTSRLVDAAVRNGSAEIIDVEDLLGSKAAAGDRADVDSLLLEILEAYDQRRIESFLSSEDGQLRHVVRDLGYSGKTIEQTLEFLKSKNAVTNADLHARAVATENASRRYTFTSFAAGVVVSILVNVAYDHINEIIRTINVWGTVLLLPSLGFVFYWLRSQYRLTYGVFEFAVGLVTSLRVFFPSFDYEGLTSIEVLQVVGGLYIMVRGLDNIGRGIAGTRLQPIWERAFSRP